MNEKKAEGERSVMKKDETSGNSKPFRNFSHSAHLSSGDRAEEAKKIYRRGKSFLVRLKARLIDYPDFSIWIKEILEFYMEALQKMDRNYFNLNCSSRCFTFKIDSIKASVDIELID